MSKPGSLDPKAQVLDHVIHIMSTNRQPLCALCTLAQPMSYMDTHPLKDITLTDLWDTNRGLLCQCLGSCYRLKARNMQIQLLYLCGNES